MLVKKWWAEENLNRRNSFQADIPEDRDRGEES